MIKTPLSPNTPKDPNRNKNTFLPKENLDNYPIIIEKSQKE